MATAITTAPKQRQYAINMLAAHWPEYLGEAAGLGLFMVSACLFTVWFEYPGSPLHQAMPNAVLRRVLTGVAMGATLIGLIYSPWGKRSGAHLNPAFTLAFLSLGKIAPVDAMFYVMAQFMGGLTGVLLTRALTGAALAHPSVSYAATTPGPAGVAAAFWAELAISMCQMTIVLASSNSKRFARFTPWFAAIMLAAYISIEAPLSGMSMNPARTLASAVPASIYTALWIYFAAPLLGMWTAGVLYSFRRGPHRVFCAKLHHHNSQRCIFRCNYPAMQQEND